MEREAAKFSCPLFPVAETLFDSRLRSTDSQRALRHAARPSSFGSVAALLSRVKEKG